MSTQDKCICICRLCCCNNINGDNPNYKILLHSFMNQLMLAPNIGQFPNPGDYTNASRFAFHTSSPSANEKEAPQFISPQTANSSNEGLSNNEEVRDNKDWHNSHAALQVPNIVQSHNAGPRTRPQATLPSDSVTKFENTKRSRTCFTSHQLIGLENNFAENRHMTRIERIRLAKVLDLNEMQVKTWFQNRRTKQKTLVNGNDVKLHELYIKEEPVNDEDTS